jgi:hypothetical protein
MQHVIFYHPQHRRVSIFLNNSLDNKRFIFKIPFQSICTIIPSLICSLTRYLKPIVFKFDHVLALSSQCFRHDLYYYILQLHASLNVHAHIPLTLWVSINLHCAHGNECMGTFVAIARDVGFHMGREQLRVFSLATFDSFR